jgi:predicted Kef-type K+ transport protein
VSVGMLIDPNTLYTHAWPVAILTLVVIWSINSVLL